MKQILKIKLNALKEHKFSFFKHYSNLNNLLINEN